MTHLRTAINRLRTLPADIQQPWTDGAGLFDLLSMGAIRSGAGTVVSVESALTMSAVWRCVNLLANTCAFLPLHVYRRNAAGNREQVNGEAERFLWGRPNPEVNRYTFWNTVFLHLVLTGNAYVYVVPAADAPIRRPAELWPIEPRRVTPRRVKGEKFYEIDGGKSIARDWIAGGEIVHFMESSMDGVVGMSPITKGFESIGLGIAAEKFSARFFGNGSQPGGFLTSDQELDDDMAAKLRRRWERLHRGPDNAHRIAVLGFGTKWNTTSLNHADAQMLETRQFQVSDVARWFGVPETLIGAHDKTSSWGSGMEQLNQQWYNIRIGPLLTNVEQTISDELLRMTNHYAKWNTAGFLRANSKDRAVYLQTLRINGIINADEWRELEDMAPLPDGLGKIYLQQSNMEPLGFEEPEPEPIGT